MTVKRIRLEADGVSQFCRPGLERQKTNHCEVLVIDSVDDSCFPVTFSDVLSRSWGVSLSACL